ncbi:MAG: hypothetical protein ACFHW5_17315 [Verrucomicrobiota bacterium]
MEKSYQLDEWDELLAGVGQQLGKKWQLDNGLEDFFRKTTKIEGFDKVHKNWKEKVHAYQRKAFGLSKSQKDITKSDTKKDEAFFGLISLGQLDAALKFFAYHILEKALNGDSEFFQKIHTAHRRYTRRISKKTFKIEFGILQFWVNGFLWMMTDDDGAYHLSKISGHTCDEQNYRKAVQRLGLIRYNHVTRGPIIRGFRRKGFQFILDASWTNLDPKLSR